MKTTIAVIAANSNWRLLSHNLKAWPGDDGLPEGQYFALLDFAVEIAARIPDPFLDYLPYVGPLPATLAWRAADVLRQGAIDRRFTLGVAFDGEFKPVPRKILKSAGWYDVVFTGSYQGRDLHVLECEVDAFIAEYGSRIRGLN
jgi:hypothetical protein